VLRARNPLRGLHDPKDLPERLLDFVLVGTLILFRNANRAAFARLARSRGGIGDPRAIPASIRRPAYALCTMGTACIALAIGLLLASSWHTIWVLLVGFAFYMMAGSLLARVITGLPAAFRRPTRLQLVLDRIREVLTNGPR